MCFGGGYLWVPLRDDVMVRWWAILFYVDHVAICCWA